MMWCIFNERDGSRAFERELKRLDAVVSHIASSKS